VNIYNEYKLLQVTTSPQISVGYHKYTNLCRLSQIQKPL